MRHLCAFLSFLLLAASAQAATVTGNLKLVTGSASASQKIDFAPLDAPFASGVNTVLPRSARTTSDVNGDFTISILQGSYRVSIESVPVGFIRVPVGTATYNINSLWACFVYLPECSDSVGSLTNVTVLSGSSALIVNGSPAAGASGEITLTLDQTQLDLSQMTGLISAAHLPTNSVTYYGVVPPGSGHASQVYGTDSSGNPGWMDAANTVGTFTPGFIPRGIGTNTLADSIIEQTATNAVTIHGWVGVTGDVTGTNFIGGAGSIFTNWISLSGQSAKYTDNGSTLLRDGVPISGGGGGISGTVINTGTPVDATIPKYNGTTGTNLAPSGVSVSSLNDALSTFSNTHNGAVSNMFTASNLTRYIFDGDSLTSSNQAWASYFVSQYLASVPSSCISNTALSGQTAWDMLYTRYTNYVQPSKPASGTNALLFAWGGINDIYYNTNTTATVIATLSNYWTQAKADGFTLVAFTISDRTDFPSYTNQYERASVNAWIRDSTIWDYLVDVDNKYPFANAAWSSADLIHFSTNSARAISDLARDSIVSTPKRSIASIDYVNPRWIGTNYFGRGAAATPSLAFSNEKNTGFSSPSTGFLGLSALGVGLQVWSSSLARMNSGIQLGWASGNAFTQNIDTWFSRTSAGNVTLNTNLTTAGAVYTSVGSKTAPTLSFTGDTGTGWYQRLTGVESWTTGGSTAIEFSSAAFKLSSITSLGWADNYIDSGTVDLKLIRDSAAVLQLGLDAASPVAQKIKAHDGSGSNATGAALTISGGNGTGTGSGGVLNFATTGAGSSGSSQNTPTNWMTIGTTGLVTVANSLTVNTNLIVNNFYTDSGNYQRASLVSTSTNIMLSAESAGTGSANVDITLNTKGTGQLIVNGLQWIPPQLVDTSTGTVTIAMTPYVSTTYIKSGIAYPLLLTGNAITTTINGDEVWVRSTYIGSKWHLQY